MNEEVNKKLKEIRTENFIWFIYIGIIFLSWYSNYLEAKYYKYNDNNSKRKYRQVMIFIFSILLVVYYYFLKSSLDDYQNLKPWDSESKKNLVTLSLLGSLFIFLSGIIFLYIAYKDQDLDVEIAFN